MKHVKFRIATLTAMVLISSSALADHGVDRAAQHKDYVHAKVLSVQPVYREIRVHTPVRECWQEPVKKRKQVRHHAADPGATLAGGLIGGIIGHQFGKGRGQKVSTALGTIIGAQIGHDASRRSHADSEIHYTQYERFCEVDNRISYEEVLDGYNVEYKYRGKNYQTHMPYDPGDKIKLRVTIEPVL